MPRWTHTVGAEGRRTLKNETSSRSSAYVLTRESLALGWPECDCVPAATVGGKRRNAQLPARQSIDLRLSRSREILDLLALREAVYRAQIVPGRRDADRL
jgi:hypothetical protein